MFSAATLLNPIRDGQPAGENLSFSPDLDAISQARKADDPTLDQGEWVTNLKEADWEFVVERCATLLETRSKDLRLAVWLAEAGAKKYRMRGLAEGLFVIAGLFEQFWDQGLYPESDGDEHDQRVGNLGWILARIPALLRDMPVTEGNDNGTGYSVIDFESARKNPNHPELKLADMDSARKASSIQFKTSFAQDANYLAEAVRSLERAADLRLGKHSPGFASVRDAVETMVHLIPAPAAATGALPGAPGQYLTLDTDPVLPHMPVQLQSGPRAALHSRPQAIAQLRAVADFFRRSEPHSPVSYFADKAANAAEQDLHAWLRSVVKDPASMAHIEELLGVRPPE